MANDLVSHPGFLLAMTYADLQADHAPDANGIPPVAKGQYGLVKDDFGPRIVKYLHCKLASSLNATAGGLYSRSTRISPTQAAGSTTTKLVNNAASFTASAHIGWVAYIEINGTVAGAAPEGESAIVTANDTTTLTLDGKRPLSAAPNATGDTIRVYSLFDFIKSASGDRVNDVFGVCLATNGITNGNWGVLQQWGYCPDVKVLSTAVLNIATALIAHTEQATVSAGGANNLNIGWAPFVTANPNRGKTMAHINVWDAALTG